MKVELSEDQHGNPTLKLETLLTDNKQSRSGASIIVATTHGQQYIGKVKGKDTYLQLNVMQIDSQTGTTGIELVRADQEGVGGKTKRAA